jgi:tetratricopeptide (TPR) repeat protein
VRTIPQLHNVYAYRGDSFAQIGNFAEAVTDFSEAIALKPHPLYFFHRGEALRALGRTVEAAEDFRRAGGVTGQLYWLE